MRGLIFFLCNTTLALASADTSIFDFSEDEDAPASSQLDCSMEWYDDQFYVTVPFGESTELDEESNEPPTTLASQVPPAKNEPPEDKILPPRPSALLADVSPHPTAEQHDMPIKLSDIRVEMDFSVYEKTANQVADEPSKQPASNSVIAVAAPNASNVPPPEVPERADFFPWMKRLALRHVQGTHEGVAYGTNYTTAAALFAPKYELGHMLPMVDARVHRFDNNTYAANLGLAGRYLPSPNTFCQILGFNIFGDWRQGLNVHHNYYQLGLGVEILARRWDLRANAYFPFGPMMHHTKCVFEFEGGFKAVHRKCEGVSYGYNAEVGYYFLGIKPATGEKPFLLYGAIGPYYLARKCHDETLGGRVRLRPQYKDYFALDLSYSYDPVYRSVFQAEIIVSLPLYQMFSGPTRRGPCGMSDRQVYQPIERFEVMPLGKRSCWHTNF